MRKRGRPTKFTCQTRLAIIQALEKGATDADACASALVDYKTFRRWINRGEDEGEGEYFDFCQNVARARSSGMITAWGVLSKAAIEDPKFAVQYIRLRQNRVKKDPQELIVKSDSSSNVEPLVGPREFVTSPKYLNRPTFWPKVLDQLEEMLAPEIQGFVIEQGQGGGKSYRSSVVLLYLLYRTAYQEVILGKDPRIEFGLDEGSEIAFANVSLTATNAREVVFEYCSNLVRESPWFQEFLPYNPGVKSKLQFSNSYSIFPGSSNISSVVGRNILGAIIDEGNLWQDSTNTTGGEDYARKMYAELQNRVLTRFGSRGYLGLVSTRRTVHDFTARKRQEISANPDVAKRYYMPEGQKSWSLWPDSRCNKQRWRLFDVDSLSFETPIEKAKTHSEIKDESGLWVPADFWISFTSQPEEALRDLASIPSETIEGFIRKKQAIEPDWEMVNPVLSSTKPTDWMRPGISFDELVSDDLVPDPAGKYFLHVDLSKNGDATGISLAYKSGQDKHLLNQFDRKPEKSILIDIPLLIQIKAPPGSEIEFAQIRKIIYWLKDKRGFKIVQVSYDGFQSVDSQQILRRQGFRVEEFSLDKKLVGYSTFKDALYEGRAFFPPAHGQTPDTPNDELRAMARSGDPCAVLQIELKQLELVDGKKVDHPKNGSKDVADSCAGAVAQCQRRYGAPAEDF